MEVAPSVKFLEYLAWIYLVLSIIASVIVWMALGASNNSNSFVALFFSIATVIQGLIGCTIMLVISYMATSLFIIRYRK